MKGIFLGIFIAIFSKNIINFQNKIRNNNLKKYFYFIYHKQKLIHSYFQNQLNLLCTFNYNRF